MGIAQTNAGSSARSAPKGLAELLKPARPLIMGILNVTPDSFSDGGRFFDPATAIAHAREMMEQGADILDIGAESTRPYGGAKPVSAEDEKDRLAPVLPEIVKLGLPVSIDTIKADIAAWALDQGAAIVNDVWGLQRDPHMAPLVAERGVPVIVMHNRDAADPTIDIVADVIAFFERSLDIAARARIKPEMIVLDPGIGFGKTVAQNFSLLARQDELLAEGFPLLAGWSRKSSLGAVTGLERPADRVPASVAAALLAAERGARVLRVHDVAATVQALQVWQAARLGGAGAWTAPR